MVIEIEIFPYLEYSFQILGGKWNGLIIHYLSLCPNGAAYFSEIKRDLTDITARALSLKLTKLTEYGKALHMCGVLRSSQLQTTSDPTMQKKQLNPIEKTHGLHILHNFLYTTIM